MEMTIDSHVRGSKREATIKRKDIVKTIGREEMNQEEFDREFVELKERLNTIMKLLQEGEEDQRYGWVLRKRKVKWHML
jgi:hypothetical protein